MPLSTSCHCDLRAEERRAALVSRRRRLSDRVLCTAHFHAGRICFQSSGKERGCVQRARSCREVETTRAGVGQGRGEGAGPTRAGVGRGSRTPACTQDSPCDAADAQAPAVWLAYPRALACPRREPEPLAEVAAWSRALNENAVGGCLRGPARHGRCGVSSVWGRSRRLLRLKPGPEAGTAGVAVCRSP